MLMLMNSACSRRKSYNICFASPSFSFIVAVKLVVVGDIIHKRTWLLRCLPTRDVVVVRVVGIMKDCDRCRTCTSCNRSGGVDGTFVVVVDTDDTMIAVLHFMRDKHHFIHIMILPVITSPVPAL
jgi:hypothetical protein